MTNKTERKAVITASTGLCLYSFYTIITSFFFEFNHLRSVMMTIGDMISYVFNSYMAHMGMLTLGICGFLLLYGEYFENKDIDTRNRFLLVKRIVFSFFVLFSVGSIVRSGYYFFISLEAYRHYLEQAPSQGQTLFTYFLSLVVMLFSIFVPIGGVLFGLYVLLKKENLRRPGLMLYLIGAIVMMINKIYTFISLMIFFIKNFSDSELSGITMRQVNGTIISFVVSILVIAAGLSIILYGMKKKRTDLDEKLNITDETAITSYPISTPQDS